MILIAATTLFIPSATQAVDVLPWMDTSLTPEQRADLLLDAMTLDQKLQQIANEPVYNDDLDADGDPDTEDPTRFDCDFTPVGRHIEGIPALGIPDFRQANGGTGIRGGDCSPEPIATALPAQVASAATFNRDLNFRWGEVLDVELRAWAHHVLWGPGMNLIRTPYGGRNNEYFSEDPYLTGVLASQIIMGIQAAGVSQATAKHLVANESEFQFERWTSATRVPSRALHELYLLPFEMAVKDADVASVMCAYPHLNFSYNCDSQPLLQQTLRQRWGFDGYVFSDRRAQQSTLASILAGVDVELDETPEWYRPELIKALINSGQITEGHIDDLLRERYIKMFEFGNFDHPYDEFLWDELDPLMAPGGAHSLVAKQAAAESLVLLRNERNILPLNAGAVESIALIGADWFAGQATLPPRSGDRSDNISVIEPYQVTPQEGLQNVLDSLGSDAEVIYNDGDVIADAEQVAADADITILMVGDVTRETWDKNSNWNEENPGGGVAGAGNEIPDLDLPSVNGTNQQQLIPRILAANPNTIVVMKTQGQVNMPWIDDVHTMVQAWYPGQEDGNVVAEALFGITNFSGKLPLTIGRTDREAAYQRQEQYPGYLENTGTPGGAGRDPLCNDEQEVPPCVDSGPAPQRVVRYSENLSMGYRWYEATGTEPLFPFGYGLSYTTFDYSDLAVTEVGGGNGHTALQVDYTITNTGDRSGMEASQVYLTLPSQAHEPAKRLVQFEKVELAPGESKRVSVLIDSNASNHPFSYFEPDDDNLVNWANGEWATPDGNYTVHVGGSSADTPLEATVGLNFSNTPPVANNVTANVTEGESVVIELDASDPDGDALSYEYTELNGHTVTPLGDGSVVRFAPLAGFTGQATFRYTVNDDHGGSANALVTVTVEPNTPSSTRLPVVGVQPARVLETRSGPGLTTIDGQFQSIGRVDAGQVLELTVAGRAGIPADADAVMLNVTAIAPDAAGFLTLFPCGTPRPLASNVNYIAGQVVPNAALTQIGTNGKICIYTLARTDIVIDINGYVPADGSPISVQPARVLETRSGPGLTTIDGQFQSIGRVDAGQVLELTVAGRAGIPADADAVMLNVTAIAPDAAGFLTLFPCGTPRPLASNVNYIAGQVVPNALLAQVGSGGKICIYTLARSDMVIDISGYVPADGSPISVQPARVLETRSGPGLTTIDGQFQSIGRVDAGQVLELTVAGRAGIPADADAVMLNVTAIAPDAAGFLTLFPCGTPRPLASNVNYIAGQVVPNAALTQIGTNGKICIYTLARTDIVIDINAYT